MHQGKTEDFVLLAAVALLTALVAVTNLQVLSLLR
jgi:hypothetical protein